MKNFTLFLVAVISVVAILTGCRTLPKDDFARVKEHMLKDEVLDIVGPPNHTELNYGKEKWYYRFYSGAESNIEDLKQITFVQGKVISVGVDTEEIKRLKEIRENDEKREVRHKASVEAHKNAQNSPKETSPEVAPATGASSGATSALAAPEPPPRSSTFKEMSGKSGQTEESGSSQ